jgi:hypothetical protein
MNATPSWAILMVMTMRRCNSGRIAQWGMSRATLEATGTAIEQVFAPYCPGGCHGHPFWCKKMSCGIVKSLFQS